MLRLLILLLALPAFTWADIPSNAWQYRADMLKSAWRVFGPDAPVATLAAQIHQESAWITDAKSWAGAEGFAQFMPGTAADMANRFPDECAPSNPYDPRWAFRCRDRYLQTLIKASHNERTRECDDWAFGLRAYNGGTKWARRDRNLAQANGANPDNWEAVAPFNSGRRASAHKENWEYPERIFKIELVYEPWGRMLGCI